MYKISVYIMNQALPYNLLILDDYLLYNDDMFDYMHYCILLECKIGHKAHYLHVLSSSFIMSLHQILSYK